MHNVYNMTFGMGNLFAEFIGNQRLFVRPPEVSREGLKFYP